MDEWCIMREEINDIMVLLTPEEKRKFLILVSVSILMGLLQAVSVVSIMPFIDVVMNPDTIYEPGIVNSLFNSLSFVDEISFQIFLGIMVLVLLLFSGLVAALTTWLQLSFVWGNNYSISRRLLANYLNRPYEYFMNRSSSEFTKNILDEVNNFTNGYLMNFAHLIVGVAVSGAVIIMLVLVDPAITIVGMLVLGGSYVIIYTLFRGKLKVFGVKRFDFNETRFKAVSEAFGGIKDVKLLNRERHFLHGYSGAAEAYAKLVARSGLVSTLPRYLFETLAFGTIILLTLLLLMGGGDITGTIPLISVFAFAAYRLMPQLQIIYNSITQMRFNQATVNNIKKEMIGAKDSLEGITTQSLPVPMPFQREVRLEGISYRHPNCDHYTLTGIDLSIAKRNSIAIVGSTGAGKTTMVDIILGLLLPQEGRILVDGEELIDSNIRSWQLNLGYVPQFIYLGDSSIKNNIAFGIDDPDIDMEKVRKAAKIAKIDEFIENDLPYGYDTMVGERGIRLSGGQRQRIGIARALYQDPEVLVLDEATSSLDGITEKAFTEALRDLSGVKTVIVIAHRFNTIRDCDAIYVMDKGKIVARGPYGDLLQGNEQFRKMANE